MDNIDARTVEGFGDEWSRYDQSALQDDELRRIFELYFSNFPWDRLPASPAGVDVGCGSGRWAQLVAPRVGKLHCVDASEEALGVARKKLGHLPNCEFHHASAQEMPLGDRSLDFGYSLGVLHHVPDTERALAACVAKLKPGAPFLLYLYYAFDNRAPWFRSLWRVSEAGRSVISRLPFPLRAATANAIAATVYWPLARSARVLERLGVDVDAMPLSAYRETSFYGMRTDARDRFGTQLERRFTKAEMRALMERAGLEDVRFSEGVPYWCAVGLRRA